MDRRDTIKSLLLGSIAGGVGLSTVPGCKTDDKTPAISPEKVGLYGRNEAELAHDQKIFAETYLTEYELTTVAVLCDIILPKTEKFGSASDAKVADFIEFIVKDIPNHQLPIRGGLMWLDHESFSRFGKSFAEASGPDQIKIIDDIAYPDKENKKPEFAQGRSFFNLMRNLTVTGYFTSKIGIDALGYVGNRPNIWDGIPEDVLKDHEVAYEEEWLAKCVDQSKREVIAEWDDDMNLIT